MFLEKALVADLTEGQVKELMQSAGVTFGRTLQIDDCNCDQPDWQVVET